jgi:hypothetical protein
MSTQKMPAEEKKAAIHKHKAESATKGHVEQAERPVLVNLQQQIGNRAVQRLIAQRAGEGDFELDDDTAARINQQRGGGQALDTAVQADMAAATGHDFSAVKVHTDPEAHALNEQLGAKAFTTGQDIFFRAGAYAPGSSGGQELLAHELTHVAQQSAGRVGGGDRMTVNAPGDAFEQEADAVARSVTNSAAANVQLQEEEEEETIQAQEIPEEEEGLQMQEEEEEEETIQAQEVPEEEEEEVQMQEVPEEEELL